MASYLVARRARRIVIALVLPTLLAACELFEGSPPPVVHADWPDQPVPPGDVIPVTGDSSGMCDADTDAGPAQVPCPPKATPSIRMDTTPGPPTAGGGG